MDDGKIFKVDTVPPPDGESDAYNAPTRVGSIEEWAALMDANESRTDASPSSERVRGEPIPVSERSARLARDASPRAIDIPPAAPLPEITVPRLDVEDDDEESEKRLSWTELGGAALEALEPPPHASVPLSLSPPRPSAFPEWVAGTNVQEKAALEEARRRKLKILMGAAVVVMLALGGLVAAVMRH